MDTNVLKQLLEKRSGHTLTSAADCEWLALDFKTRCGESIGVNTLKRLLGFLEYDGKTFRPSTLDIVARYLGFNNWDETEKALRDTVSDFGDNPNVLNDDSLAVGDSVTITYNPDRKITFEYSGDE